MAVVTAGSRGLGRATALALAAEGCDLVLSSRGGDALRTTAADAAALGVTVEVVEADVTDPGTPGRLVVCGAGPRRRPRTWPGPASP